jgi:hypothetical protein
VGGTFLRNVRNGGYVPDQMFFDVETVTVISSWLFTMEVALQ